MLLWTDTGPLFIYKNIKYFQLNSIKYSNVIKIKKISFKLHYVIYKDIDYKELPENRIDVALENWIFKIIRPEAINYWNSWDVSFGILDIPLNFKKFAILSIKFYIFDDEVLIKYNTKDSIILFKIIRFIHSDNNEDNCIEISCNNKKINILDRIKAFEIISSYNELCIFSLKNYDKRIVVVEFNDKMLIEKIND